MNVIVVNAPNTANLEPSQYGCNSWREYWDKNGGLSMLLFSGFRRSRFASRIGNFNPTFLCPACGKIFHWDGVAPDCFDGCHVNIVGDITKKLYITPLCHTCNQKDVTASVDKINLIPAP